MRKYEMTLWGQLRRLIRRGKGWTLRRWCNELGHCLLLMFFPLLTASDDWSKTCESAQANVHRRAQDDLHCALLG